LFEISIQENLDKAIHPFNQQNIVSSLQSPPRTLIN